jgi:hypothetical protein
MNSPYAYVLEIPGQEDAIFNWPAGARKYIRDTYTVDGRLCLPPPGHISLQRYKVNPKVGQRINVISLPVEAFLGA